MMTTTATIPLLLAALLPAAAKGEGLDVIVARHLEASGGAKRLKALKSVRMKGEMSITQGQAPLSGTYVLEMKRPRLYRMDFTLIGLTAVQAYDGKAGWTVTPFSGDPNAHPMTPEEEVDMAPRVEFDTLLLDYKARGTRVELLGTEDVNGAPAYKLKVTPKVGSERYVYLDRKTYLEVKREELRQGGKDVIEGVVGDYRKVGELTLPHSFESGPKGGEKAVKLKIATIELDAQIDDARFQKPDTKLPVAPPIPAGAIPGATPPGVPGAPPAAAPAVPPIPLPMASPAPSPSPSPRSGP
jgi:outer membrane lipoprotein-sorting protein